MTRRFRTPASGALAALLAVAGLAASILASSPAEPADADHIPLLTPHPVYPNEVWGGDTLGWGHYETRFGDYQTNWRGGGIDPIPWEFTGATVVPDSGGTYLPYPHPAHPIQILINATMFYWNNAVPIRHENKWGGQIVNGVYKAGPFVEACLYTRSCLGGHISSPQGFVDFQWHRDKIQYRYLVFVYCGTICDGDGGVVPPPDDPPPTTVVPEIPPRPVAPVADYVLARLDLTSQAFAAEGDFRHHGATVSSIRLMCTTGYRCSGEGAPQLIGVTGTLSMTGVGSYEPCASMTSRDCDYYTTRTDTTTSLQTGDGVAAAFFSPTTGSERMRIQFQATGVRVQTYEPQLRSIYNDSGVLIAYEWVWVRSSVISVPVRFNPDVPLDMIVVGSQGN